MAERNRQRSADRHLRRNRSLGSETMKGGLGKPGVLVGGNPARVIRSVGSD
jgi:hypothetical protein